MSYTSFVTFVEQPIFTKRLVAVLADEDYRQFQVDLAAAPEKWPVVKGSGGLRKARVALAGRGKSGSARVLYLWLPNRATIVFYLLYTKGNLETVPAAQMKAIKYEVQRIKKAFGEGN